MHTQSKTTHIYTLMFQHLSSFTHWIGQKVRSGFPVTSHRTNELSGQLSITKSLQHESQRELLLQCITINPTDGDTALTISQKNHITVSKNRNVDVSKVF